MLPVLEDPAIRARVHPIRVEDYHRMYQSGTVVPNVELLRGTLVEKMPKSPLHASIVTRICRYLFTVIPPDWHVRSEQPLTLADSEPEPDVSVVRGAEQDFFKAHPTKADLVIEVSVTSEAIDRLKLQLYAEAGVPECWLILAEERIVERYTEPQDSIYQKVERAEFSGGLGSTVFSGLRLPPAGV